MLNAPNAECGVRSAECKSRCREANDLPFRFRIPHSALSTLFLALLAGPAAAQVDPSGSWRTLHTPHFRVHFRPVYRELALLEAREAERAYGLLSAELRPPRQVVDLTLGDDIDDSNGFTTVFPSSQITILASPPVNDPGLLPYDTWLRLVTTHELTHVFHLDRAKSFWGVLQRVFGRAPGLFPNQYQPSWVTEGLAVYYESKFTNGGRIRGSFHTQLLAADHVAGTSRSPGDALLFTRWPGGFTPYVYGSRFFQHLAETAGDSAVPWFVEATAEQLIPFRVGRQLDRVTRPGGRARTLATVWPAATRPAPARGESEPGMRVLDSLLRGEPVPAVSPDGRRVAYLRDDGKGASELCLLEWGTLRRIASHEVNGNVSYGWLGDTLVVAQLDYTSRWRIRSDLYRWRPGSGWRRGTRGARLAQPRGGGGRLVALALTPGANRPTVPAPDTAGATWEAVVPSPDGRWMAGVRNAAGQWALVRWPADSPGVAVVLVKTRGAVTDPVWTAGGELWFVADQPGSGGGFPQVYRWRDASGAEPLTAEPLGARAPAPLPDGTLLYSVLTAGGWELRHAAALPAGAPTAFPTPLPFEPAPAVPVRETGYAPWPSLRPHFWVPLFLDAGATGRFFGAATAGRDAIGRFEYVAWGLLAGGPLRATGSFGVLSGILANPTLDLWASSDWSYVGASATGIVVSERDQDAALGASFVTRRWHSVASVRVAAEYEGTRFVARPETSLATACPGCAPQDLVGGSVTLALAHFVSAPLAVSRQDGFVWSATYRRREEQGSGRWSNEVRSRLGLYRHFPGPSGFGRAVLALRLAAGATGGPLNRLLNAGGVSSGSLDVVFGPSLGATRTFPVRGYGNGELRGRRVATATVEYRLPLALVGRSLGRLPLGADKLWLNLFGDAGDAWNPGAAPRLTRLRSAGLELAGDVTVSYDFPLQLRLGVAEPLADPPSGGARRAQVYLALASDF